MTGELERLCEQMMQEIGKSQGIRLSDIPGIDLYMDQLTTFMDEHLRERTRNPEEDKILTKTMINNYAKNDLLPPPVRKKYSKDHLILLIFIYYLKSLLSINDIETVLKTARDYFHVSDLEEVTLSDIYETVSSLILDSKPDIQEDIRKKAEIAAGAFAETGGEAGEDLRRFAFLMLLSYDVYLKKLLIEKTVDELRPEMKEKKKKRKEDKN